MKIHLNSLNAGPNNVASILNNFIKLQKITLKTLKKEKKTPTTISAFLSLKRINLGIKIREFWRKLILFKIDVMLMDLTIPFICLLFYTIQNILETYGFLILNPQQTWEMLLKGLGRKERWFFFSLWKGQEDRMQKGK